MYAVTEKSFQPCLSPQTLENVEEAFDNRQNELSSTLDPSCQEYEVLFSPNLLEELEGTSQTMPDNAVVSPHDVTSDLSFEEGSRI